MPIIQPALQMKTMLRMTCEACKQKFGNRELQQLNLEIDSDLLLYFESINRVGLTYPSNFLFDVIQCAYNVFNVFISKYEKEFLKVVNQSCFVNILLKNYSISISESISAVKIARKVSKLVVKYMRYIIL